MILDISPPDAIVAKGFTGSPGFAERKNSTVSIPFAFASNTLLSIDTNPFSDIC